MPNLLNTIEDEDEVVFLAHAQPIRSETSYSAIQLFKRYEFFWEREREKERAVGAIRLRQGTTH